ncbi:MAG TPA: hypothetical protein DFS52_03420 [Myxococcales bacterium]|nr:hypothetical protein [Myxococcales bacterium]
MDLSTLRHLGEGLLSQLARAEYRQRAGLHGAVNLASIYSGFQALSSNDAWALARGGIDRATDQASRGQASRFARLVALAHEGSVDAEPRQERLEAEAKAAVCFEGEPIAFRALGEQVAGERDRHRRAELARARDSVVASFDRAEPRRIEQRMELADKLGFTSYPAMAATLGGFDLGALAAEARATLLATEDAYRDLMAYGLKRAVGRIGLEPHGEAAEHDLERFGHLAPYAELFAPRGLLTVSRRFLEWIGLPLEASGTVRLDLEPRPTKAPGCFVACFSVPDRMALTLRPAGGAGDYSELLHGLGVAAFFGSVHPEALFENRWLADPALPKAFGLVFENLLLDEGFLIKALGAGAHEAGEAARFLAIERLLSLRLLCAQLAFELDLYEEGPRAELKGYYRETLGKAALCDWPLEWWLWRVEPGFPVAARLRGWSLEAPVHQALLDRANEDYWRNPRMGALLAAWSERGGELDATALAEELGARLSLASAAQRLVAVAAR